MSRHGWSAVCVGREANEGRLVGSGIDTEVLCVMSAWVETIHRSCGSVAAPFCRIPFDVIEWIKVGLGGVLR